jgi:acylphosphatase
MAGSRGIRLLISGRVQGVFFRAYTREEAQRLGLKGWVRNLNDGRVEVYAEGDPEKLKSLEALCRRGPPYAHVRSVEVIQEERKGSDLHSFEITF